MFLLFFLPGRLAVWWEWSIEATDFYCTRTSLLWFYVVFMKCAMPVLRTSVCIFVASCWWVIPLISMKWSLSFCTSFVGSLLCWMLERTSECFLGVFAWHSFFSFHPVVMRHMEAANGSCFLIQLTNLSLLIGQLRPLIRVVIERYVFVLVTVFCSFMVGRCLLICFHLLLNCYSSIVVWPCGLMDRFGFSLYIEGSHPVSSLELAHWL